VINKNCADKRILKIDDTKYVLDFHDLNERLISDENFPNFDIFIFFNNFGNHMEQIRFFKEVIV
jgi:hypothetical protein